MKREDFKERFRELYDLSGCSSITQFAKMLDMNRQNVDRYYNGERRPDAPALAQICEKTGVSADWLLARTDVRSSSADILNAVNTLGLSEDSIKAIIDPGGIGKYKRALSHLIVQERFKTLLENYEAYLLVADYVNHDPGESEGENVNYDINLENRTVTLPFEYMLDVQLDRIVNTISLICKDEVLPYATYDPISKTMHYPRREFSQRQKDIEEDS